MRRLKTNIFGYLGAMAFFGLVCAAPTHAEIEFVGYMSGHDGIRFALIDSAKNQSSAWLKVGQEWHGSTIDSFEATQEALTLHDPSHSYQLKLKADQANAPLLQVNLVGKTLNLSTADAARLMQRIEKIAISAALNSRDNSSILGKDLTRGDFQNGPNLHVHYPSPRELKTAGGAFVVSDIWIQIRDTDPYPGPVMIEAEGKPVNLVKYSGAQILALGLDPALFDHLSPHMQHTLEPMRGPAGP